MIAFFKKNRTVLSSLIAGLLVTSFVLAPLSLSPRDRVTVQVTYAGWATEASNMGDWLSNIYNGVGTWSSVAYDAAALAIDKFMEWKDSVGDGIVWQLVNMLIQQMIRSITRWVASGFAGSPSFVTDLKGFLMGVGDQVAGQWIARNVPLLCSPFQLNIRMALIAQYQQTTRPRTTCTLTGSVQNLRNFTNGSFRAGGWQQWFNVAMTPSNNPYGAALDAQFAMDASIRTAQGQEFNLLKFGQGFFSKKQNGEVVNPGKMVETQLNNMLDLANKRIAVADEINELIAAFLSTIVNSILSSPTGLAGMGGGAGGANSLGSDAYWDSMAAQSSSMGLSGGGDIFTREVPTITQNTGYYSGMASSITDASNYMSTRYPTCTSPAGTLTPSLQSQLTAYQAKITSNDAIVARLNEFNDDYAALGRGDTTLFARYNATSATEAQGNLMNAYNSYIASVGLPGNFITDNATLQGTGQMTVRGNLATEIATFTAAIDTACRTTGTAPTTPIT